MGGHAAEPVDATDPTPNRRRIGRALGMLFLLQGALGEAWVLLPHDDGQSMPLLLVCLVAQAIGLWLRSGALDEAPVWVLKAMVTVATLLSVAGCVFSGPAPTGFAFFFLWVTPYAVYFGLRQAVLQTFLAVGGLIGSRVFVADGQIAAGDLGEWLFPAATIVVVSSIV